MNPKASAKDRPNDRTILFLHGANFEMLGVREPEVYGAETLQERIDAARLVAEARGWSLEDFQSSSQAELVTTIHAARGRCAAIIVNPGAFTHYAWALHDALAIFDGVIIEVHLSNPNARESWRHTSVVSPVATGSIVGLGGLGYELAVEAAIRKADQAREQL